MTTTTDLINEITNDDDAYATLRDMMLATACPDDDAPDYSYNDDDFESSTADDDAHAARIDAIERRLRPLYDSIINDDDARTTIALACDLCPLHLCDLDICADDRIAACSQFR